MQRAGASPARASDTATDVPLLELRDLAVRFPVERGTILRRGVAEVRAVDGVSLDIRRGEVLGLVGESGCGKSTLARAILKLVAPSGGRILLEGEDIWRQDRAAELAYRRRVQAIFQDPFSSLNPRMTVGDTVAEPLRIHAGAPGLPGRHRGGARTLVSDRVAIDARVRELLDLCGLPARMAERYPHEMSGGQRQRVGIARALALEADLIVCDEAVSALDVSIQAQILNLLAELREELGLTYLFIGHDLGVIRHLCDRVAVMYLGRLVELADGEALFADPLHPYTRALLAAIPLPDPEREAMREHVALEGEISSSLAPPEGCVFHPRCPRARTRCAESVPPLVEERPAHLAACLRIDEPDEASADPSVAPPPGTRVTSPGGPIPSPDPTPRASHAR